MNKKVSIFLLLSLALAISPNFANEVSQQDLARYSAYYSNGMDYLKNQQFNSAIVEFKKVLRFSPYDKTTQNALINAYYARAHYYKNTTKELKKALNDYKSAYFYLKYWSKDSISANNASIASNSLSEITSLERKLSIAQNEASRLSNAKILKAQGELAAAGYDFELLKNGKNKAVALENLGNIFKNLNNLVIAMDYYKNAIDINPENPRLHFLYGVMLDEAQNYEASIEQYNLALQYGEDAPELLEILENKWTQNLVNNPTDAQSYINLGAIYQKQNNFESAKAQYLKACALDSSNEIAYLNLASLYIEQKKYIEAIGVYDKLLIKNPENIEYLKYKADAYLNLSRYDEALAQLEKIATIQPNNQDIKVQIDNIVLKHFSGQKLISYLTQKALKNPNSYEAQFNLALEYHKNNDFQNAILYYKKAINLNPAKEESYINLIQILIEQKNYILAKETAERGLLVMPNNQKLNQYLADIDNYSASSQYELATKLFNEKKYSQAIEQYQKIQNKTQEVNMAIASCYLELQDYNSANKYYLDILSKNPQDKDALLNSAWAYYMLGEYDSAKSSANKVLILDKTNASAKDILDDIISAQNSKTLQEAILKYENADYASSLALLNKIPALNQDEYVLYYKGLNCDELTKKTEAIKQYRLLIEKYPEFTSAYYSLALDLDEAEKYQEAVENYEKFLNLKAKAGEKDDLTTFSKNRIKELKEYLDSLNVSKK